MGICLASHQQLEVKLADFQGSGSIGLLPVREAMQHRVLNGQEPGHGVSEGEIHLQGKAINLRRVKAHSKDLKEIFQRDVRHHAWAGIESGTWRQTLPEFKRPAKIEVAPGGSFRLVAQLLQGIGQQRSGGMMLLIHHYHLVQHLYHPPVVANCKVGLGLFHNCICTTHVGDLPSCLLGRRQGVQVSRVAVKETQVFHIDSPGIGKEGTIVVAAMEFPAQGIGQLNVISQLVHGVAVIGKAQCLIMDVLVKVALLFQVGKGRFAAMNGPVVGGKLHFKPVPKEIDGFIDLHGPVKRIPDLGAPGRIDIVQVMGGDLRHAQGGMLREEENHFRRRLCAHGHLKLYLHAVNIPGFTRFIDNIIGHDEASGAHGQGSAQASGDKARGRGFQQVAIHVGGAAVHHIAGQDVLGQRLFHKVLGCQDGDLLCLLVRGDPQDPGKVICMAMGVNDGDNWPLAKMLIGQVKRCPG